MTDALDLGPWSCADQTEIPVQAPLGGQRHCTCGRRIWDPVSLIRGKGPVCWGRANSDTGNTASRTHDVSPDQLDLTELEVKERAVSTEKVIRWEVVRWDWREQPDMDRINAEVAKVFDGATCPTIVPVETGSDDYAVVVSGEPLTPDEAQAAYWVWWRKATGQDD